ncbi:MAG: 1-acyl-sn-glycerol-3-phosphate acyltransferase [Candidatus Omnitrophota bacterium]|nr:MAG: 1-acyl-sn-glycerol-3-phosphate acyltransferase [Candidatus Omnitrophota bacterium]
MLYSILKPLAVFVFKVFFRMEVKGREKIPERGRFILASNHLSFLDPVVLGVACPRRLYFLAKEELFRNSLFSLFIRVLGAIPLRRNYSDLKAIKKSLAVLNKENPLVIFPQGTRERYDGIKEGVGFLAKKSKSPVVVARIIGTDKVLPKGEKKIRLKKIKVIFDKLSDNAYPESYQEFSLKVFERIMNLD